MTPFDDAYEPLDLSAFLNAGVAMLGSSRTPPLGQVTLRGLPFWVGDDPDRCFLGAGQGLASRAIEIPLGRRAYHMIFAHRLIDSRILEGGPVGTQVAEYQFAREGGSLEKVGIRERFEIAVVATPEDFVAPEAARWGQEPFLARPDRGPELPPRWEGPWGLVGYRQCGLQWGDAGVAEGDRLFDFVQPQPLAHGYYLWTWTNSRPEIPLNKLTVCPMGPRFVIAGITLVTADEYPFPAGDARAVRVDVQDPAVAAAPFDLDMTADRGEVSFAYPLSAATEAEFMQSGRPGFGLPCNRSTSPSYVRARAVPSATIEVRRGAERLASFRWRDVERPGGAASDDVSLRLVESGRNWVRMRVVDDATGHLLPCRIHFRSPDGVPYQPHGHHSHVNGELTTWNGDIGGDLRLGGATYAYIDGRCEGWLPRGRVLVDLAAGYEYRPVRRAVEIAPGQQDLELRVRRMRDLNAEGWYSGDTHVHFLSAQGSQLEARGEGLNVVNLLIAQWGHLFTGVEEFTGAGHVSADGRTIVRASQENRQHVFGHRSLLGLRNPVYPLSTDGPEEGEIGEFLETTLAAWADACHRDGGTVVLPHFPAPNGEPAALIATGRADALEFHVPNRYSHDEYYRYLNAGYRLPLVGGTDKMTSEMPVGICRTYVHIPDEDLTYEAWCRNLARGRTFLSTGPLLSFEVEGHGIGDTVHARPGATLEVTAAAQSIFPLHTLQLVEHGRVVAAAESASGAERLELRERVAVSGDTWFAVRAGGPDYFGGEPHHDLWARRIVAHSSPVYVTCGDEWTLHDEATLDYMLTLVSGGLEYVRDQARHIPSERITHHHGGDHLDHLERPFLQAIEAIHRRMHERGVPH